MDSVIKKDFILKELRYAIKNDHSSCSYKVKQFIIYDNQFPQTR